MERLFRIGFLFIFCFIGCSSQPEVPDDRILAKVGSSIITIQDFIRRAEYTIRPAYCRQANYIHKKIVLNSLIGEKLVAMEFEKRSDKIMTDDHLETFLKGRREQAMRQIYFAEEFHSKVHLPDSEINPAYKLAGRKVAVEFLNLPDLETVRKIRNLVTENVTMDSIHNNLWGGPAPSREFTWFDREQNAIHQALFTNDVKKGQLVGPFKTEDDTYIVMRIKGWTDQVAVTESDRRRRWDDVKERITEQKAKKTYIKWVEDLMSGKEMNLNPDVFNAYSSRAADFFFKMDSAKQNAMNQAIWNEPEILDQPTFTLDGSDMDLDPNSVLLEYDGKNWTVNDFNEELRSHPFVFRKRKMNRSEFSEQLRLAIADVFRDIEITKQCYRDGYDEYWSVGTHVDMWRDASLSRKYAARIKSNNQQINDQEQWLDFMNPVIDSLQAVYSKQIKINMDAFESIELTETDMMVTQRGVPFPTVVPSFPIVTTDSRLDYGSKSNLDD